MMRLHGTEFLKYLPGVGMVTASKIIEKIIAEKGLDIDEFEKSQFAGEMKRLAGMLERAKADTDSDLRGK